MYESSWRNDFSEFLRFARGYTRNRFYVQFSRFEVVKDVLVDLLYKRRGKYARPFIHTGMMFLLFSGIAFGPFILDKARAEDTDGSLIPTGVMQSVTDYNTSFSTIQGKEVAEFRGGEVVEHEVKDGETVASIAQMYNLSSTTLIWLNNLNEDKPIIKSGQRLKILPVDGVLHKVKKGETVASIAKLYGLEDAQAQGIVNYPFNTFVNDETFQLAVGQELVVPDGVKPKPSSFGGVSNVASVLTPDAGTVAANGAFIWPASGRLTQGFKFYHKAIDIASHGGGNILAADSGKVIVAGWPDNSGYGNRIVVDHGNGYVSLYAHLSLIQVKEGQNIKRGDVIGQMGSTGRSTGTHLHFEIRHSGVLDNPQSYLQ